MRIVIIGAVAAGASAAARARRLSESAEIVLVERGEAPSFANCGLPYYVGGVISSRDKLLVAPEERLRQRYRLDVRTRTEAVAVDRAKKQVRVRNLRTGDQYDLNYDKLILAPGATPVRPPVAGSDLPGVYVLRDLADADRLYAAVAGAKRAVVVGGGFIGVEMVENLVRRGIATTLVELNRQVLPPWDAEMVSPVAEHIAAKGVTLKLGDSAESIERNASDGSLRVKLKSGAVVEADFVVMSVGVRPENKLAAEAGLAVGPRGGIQVNRHMQTSDSDVYAAGDAVETVSALDGGPTQIPLGGPANRQGRIAADHIFGRSTAYRGTQGTAIVGAFEMTAAMTGSSEKALIAAKREYLKAYVHPAHHAGYYPGAEAMSMKLLFSPSGKILGAQVVGRAGVDKRIDVLAVAIQAGMTVYDLEEMELAYAPQYGSAKDPINMLGFVAAGMLREDQPATYSESLLEGAGNSSVGEPLVLDVRTAEEFAAGHVPGAVNVPLDELRERLGELPRERKIVAYCKVGQRGYLAARLLAQHDFDVENLSGGFTTYQATVAARK
jgi:NADPH-dependent 2,4-dienoyl-CoA reductase/sulfur reductase-like enzyme/rhodanese-related sulfurtransferase